ncbi:hypothetical protein [Blastopirellula marina]|uniref:Uncharacterized protein n=1 Tax=Blastopirellula marina TaxID=124 RepID=A0A2S8GQX9_9BACT|nr:hypothetical protein [Blastopirellula marina]PQO46771.1 hypothetical protein C5Y93_08035 [Blastopirellula marina]
MKKSSLYSEITQLLASNSRSKAISLIESSQERLSESEYQECLGNVHFYNREFQQALPFYDRAFSASDDYYCARHYYIAGVQMEQMGRLAYACEQFQAAISIEPTFVDAYVELGGLLVKIEDFEGALQCYTDAISLDPNDLAIRHNLVQVLTELATRAPATFSEPLRTAQAEYDSLKQTQEQPGPGRVW